jgi:hypothetical protein
MQNYHNAMYREVSPCIVAIASDTEIYAGGARDDAYSAAFRCRIDPLVSARWRWCVTLHADDPTGRLLIYL